jgi:GNAT superfamily N-acetyltransferase
MRTLSRCSVITFWAAPTTVARSAPSVEFRQVGAEAGAGARLDRAQALEIAGVTGLSVTEAAFRLASGARWIGLERNGVVASSGWVSSGATRVGEIGAWFVPAPGSAYVWDCFTLPDFRGHGLYHDLLAAAIRSVQPFGVRTVWIAVEWDNWRSVAGIIHAGFQPVGAVASVPVWRTRAHVLVPAANDEHQLLLTLRRSISTSSPTGLAAISEPMRNCDPSRLAGDKHRQWPERSDRGRGLFPTNRGALERPSTRTVDPDERQAS